LGQNAKIRIVPIVTYLGKKDFLFGSELRFLDFYTVELFDFIQWLSDSAFYAENKNV